MDLVLKHVCRLSEEFGSSRRVDALKSFTQKAVPV